MSDFKGHPTFVHLTNPLLRTWNQCAMFFNLIGQQSLGFAKQYVSSLPKEHIKDVRAMFQRIKKDGYEDTRAAVNRELQAGESSGGS